MNKPCDRLKDWGSHSDPRMWTVIGIISLCAVTAIVIMVGSAVYLFGR